MLLNTDAKYTQCHNKNHHHDKVVQENVDEWDLEFKLLYWQ